MATIEQVRALGYEVSAAFGADDPDNPTVYSVSGFGVQTYVAENDAEALASLADPDAHAERVEQAENGPPEFESSPEMARREELRTKLADGTATQDEKDELLLLLVGA